MFGQNTDAAIVAKMFAYTSQIQLLTAQTPKVKTGLERVKQCYLTIMLSFYVLIGLNKVPELILALLRHELTEEEDDDGGSLIKTCL